MGAMLCKKLYDIGWLVAHIAVVPNEVRHLRDLHKKFCDKPYQILLSCYSHIKLLMSSFSEVSIQSI